MKIVFFFILCFLVLVQVLGDYTFHVISLLVMFLILGLGFLYMKCLFKWKIVYLVMGLFSIFYFLSSQSAWCCVKKKHQKQLCNLFTMVTNELKKNNVDNFLCFGSLLGAVRDGNEYMQMLPWEHDTDLCIFDHDIEKLNTIFNFSGIFYDVKKMRVKKMDFFHRTFGKLAFVDFFPLTMDGNEIYISDYNGTKKTYFNKSVFEEKRVFQYCNGWHRGPNDADLVLKLEYGNYMEKKMPRNIWQKFFCNIYVDCNYK